LDARPESIHPLQVYRCSTLIIAISGQINVNDIIKSSYCALLHGKKFLVKLAVTYWQQLSSTCCISFNSKITVTLTTVLLSIL